MGIGVRMEKEEENIVTSSVFNRVISFEPGRMSNLNWVSILGV